MSDERQRRSLSGLAVAAAVCSIVTLLLLLGDFVLGGAQCALAGCILFGGWWGSLPILGPGVLGVAAAVRIALSRGKLGGWGFCLLGITTTLLWLALAFYAFGQ
jgi:hypothetical protein